MSAAVIGSGWQGIATKGQWVGEQAERNYGLWLNEAGLIHLSYLNAGGDNITLDTERGSISKGEWTHVAGVIDTQTGIMKI